MAEIRHLENRQIAIILPRKKIRFWWNLVHKCSFESPW